jgi:hypothetical protein
MIDHLTRKGKTLLGFGYTIFSGLKRGEGPARRRRLGDKIPMIPPKMLEYYPPPEVHKKQDSKQNAHRNEQDGRGLDA